MKKIAFSLMVVGLLFIGNGVSAQVLVDCGENHKIWNSDNSKVVSCIPKADWDRSVAESMSVNQDDGSFVKIARGQKLLTSFGFEDTCPTWFPMSCVIKKTLFVKWL